jgi:hypothetical protein
MGSLLAEFSSSPVGAHACSIRHHRGNLQKQFPLFFFIIQRTKNLPPGLKLIRISAIRIPLKKLEIVIRAASPYFQNFFAMGFPRRLWRRNMFELSPE